MWADAAGFGILAAFVAGILSFLSPCVVPLVPGYLSLISGAAIGGEVSERPSGLRMVIPSLIFVLGFTLVFVALGASASVLGGLIDENRRMVNRLAGVIMIIMGLFVLGALRVPWMYREQRFHLQANRNLTRSETMLLGMAFGFGWTPCIGPFLASVLVYTSTAETVGRGTLLLLAYALGLGLPFIIVGVGVSRILGTARWVSRHYRAVSVASGATLILVGALFLTDRFFYVNIAAQRLYSQVLGPVAGT